MKRDVYTKGEWTSRWAEDNPRGTWIPKIVKKSDADKGKLSAVLCCKGCGKCVGISNHDIDDNGDVNPSVVCSVDGCDYHQWAHLEGWTGKK